MGISFEYPFLNFLNVPLLNFYFMKKIIMSIGIAFLSTVLVSCQSSLILKSTFEGDAVGSLPTKMLPGDPSGDVIQYSADIESQLRVQNSATAGEKALHYTNSAIASGVSEHGTWLGFRGVETNLVNPLWFMHTGKNVSPTGDVLIDVGDGHGNLMARMRIRPNGEVGLARNILDLYTDVIGTLGPDGHTIIFTATPSELKYNITIFQNTGGAITATDKPMITKAALTFANPAHPTLSFKVNEPRNSNHKYVIESVTITKKRPE